MAIEFRPIRTLWTGLLLSDMIVSFFVLVSVASSTVLALSNPATESTGVMNNTVFAKRKVVRAVIDA